MEFPVFCFSIFSIKKNWFPCHIAFFIFWLVVGNNFTLIRLPKKTVLIRILYALFLFCFILKTFSLLFKITVWSSLVFVILSALVLIACHFLCMDFYVQSGLFRQNNTRTKVNNNFKKVSHWLIVKLVCVCVWARLILQWWLFGNGMSLFKRLKDLCDKNKVHNFSLRWMVIIIRQTDRQTNQIRADVYFMLTLYACMTPSSKYACVCVCVC